MLSSKITKSGRKDPNRAKILLREALSCHQKGLEKEAKKLYLQCINIGGCNEIVYSNLGSIYEHENKVAEAYQCYQNAIKINDKFGPAYANLATLLINNRYDMSDYFVQLKRRGLRSDQKEFNKPDVLNISKIAVTLNPTCITSRRNYANLLVEKGNFQEAYEEYKCVLKIENHDTKTIMSLGLIFECQRELAASLACYQQAAQKASSPAEIHTKISSLISITIILVQTNRIEEARKILKILNLLVNNGAIFDKLNKKSIPHIAYIGFLSHLVPLIPTYSEYNQPHRALNILHVGDSHCLSFANQQLKLKYDNYIISPALIRGCKAWHLGSSENNQYKQSFLSIINKNANDYSYIFLSVGEIDCRVDEGIILHALRKGIDPLKTCIKTVNSYIRFILDNLENYLHKLVIFGIPAPCPYEISDIIDPKQNNQRKLVVKLFNDCLKNEATRHNIVFLDIYNLTAANDGSNNQKWMLDQIHLKPETIQQIENMTNNFNSKNA